MTLTEIDAAEAVYRGRLEQPCEGHLARWRHAIAGMKPAWLQRHFAGMDPEDWLV